MLNKLTGIQERYNEINQELMQVGDDYQRATELAKERSDLEPLIQKAEEYQQTIESLEEAKLLLDGDDPELTELAELEIANLEPLLPKLEREIKGLLLPQDPRDERNVIVEIRAGAGGDEAGLFAAGVSSDCVDTAKGYVDATKALARIVEKNDLVVILTGCTYKFLPVFREYFPVPKIKEQE